MEWINVEEKLPRDGENVLTYCAPYVRTAEVLYFESNRGVNWLDGGTVFHGVTHWMPLPDAPN